VLLAALPGPAAVQWQPVVDGGPVFTPVTTPVLSPVPTGELQADQPPAPPRWQRVDAPGSGSAPSGPVRWAQAPATPAPAPTPVARVQPAKPPAVVRSVGRAFTYGGRLYPEVGFFIPTAFRQDLAHRFTIGFEVDGKTNPYNTGNPRCGGFTINAKDPNCSDSHWLAEFTPLIVGDLSLGVNATMQESIINRDKGSSSYKGGEGLGLAWGFQLKSNLAPTLGLAWIGNNLISNDETGPIGNTKSWPSSRRPIAADLGQGYAFLLSKIFDFGPIFGGKGDPPALISTSFGIGNGIFQASNQVNNTGLNYGPYGPIANLAISFSQHLSVFAEWAGYYAGFGASLKPFDGLPLTATIFYHDWRGSSTSYLDGNPYSAQCGIDTNRCKGALNSRLTWSF